MMRNLRTRLVALAAAVATALPLAAVAEDIDIFVGATGSGSAANPNVLIVLDNTSNWSRNDQKWPNEFQGESELQAIKEVISTVGENVNVGLMMFTDNGTGNEGGYIRYHIRSMTDTNKASFQSLLQNIYDNFRTPAEKGPSSADYSAPLFDVFKYFGGFTSPANATTDIAGAPLGPTAFGPDAYADPALSPLSADLAAYTSSAKTTYNPPLSPLGSCGKNYVIFIGNGFPNADDTAGAPLDVHLNTVGGDTTQAAMPDFTLATTPGTTTTLGQTAACYSDCGTAWSTEFAAQCASPMSCSCSASSSQGCGKGKNSGAKYTVQATAPGTATVTPTGTFSLPGSNKLRMADEWTRFLYKTDVSAAPGQQNVSTYTIDVFNAKPDADQTSLMYSMARAGGGKYFAATNKNAIIEALKEIFLEIQSVNSVFASVTLPVNANNRAQNENQVYVGVFRPDPDAKPRWFGNLKRFQLASFGGFIDMADATGARAVNLQTGFLGDCSASYWTSDSGNYWENVPISPSPAGVCSLAAYAALDPFSDLPDGPKVEKGGVAEVIRKGNNPPATDGSPTWGVNRNVLTVSGGALTAFNTASSGLSADVVDFISGKDVDDENANASQIDSRPSVHGDVIHSRPRPINYGSGAITVFYGANDGTLRAVDANTGRERWALVAPEFFPRLSRLKDNSPLVAYPGLPTGLTPTPTRKDYFFDGSIGAYQNEAGTSAWIFPSMRRGGRMIYALDVSNPDSPALKWRVGCPNLTNDTGCTSGYSAMGQTWSTPAVAFIKGYMSGNSPIVLVGGGYDACEDYDGPNPACSGRKGAVVYAINANDGSIVKEFAASGLGSVAADLALADVNYDGLVDHAYAADTTGNIWRISFVDADAQPLDVASWTITKVAYTSGAGRKFLFAPAVLANKGKIYLAIGSGDREHPLASNYTASITNRFYVYVDDPSITTAHNLDDTSTGFDFSSDTSCDTDGLLSDPTKRSWFMNLTAGEQSISSALIIGGMATFNTNRAVTTAAQQCASPLGEAKGYWVNLLNASGAIGVEGACGGNRSSIFVGGGLPPSPVRGIVPIGGKPESIVISAVQKDGSASSPIGGQKIKPPISSKRNRLYWYQSGDN